MDLNQESQQKLESRAQSTDSIWENHIFAKLKNSLELYTNQKNQQKLEAIIVDMKQIQHIIKQSIVSNTVPELTSFIIELFQRIESNCISQNIANKIQNIKKDFDSAIFNDQTTKIISQINDVNHQIIFLIIAHEKNQKSQENILQLQTQKNILQLQEILIHNLSNAYKEFKKGPWLKSDIRTHYPNIIKTLNAEQKWLNSIKIDEEKVHDAKRSFISIKTLFHASLDIFVSMDIGEALQIAEQSVYNT